MLPTIFEIAAYATIAAVGVKLSSIAFYAYERRRLRMIRETIEAVIDGRLQSDVLPAKNLRSDG